MSEHLSGEGLNPRERISQSRDINSGDLLPNTPPLLDHMLHVCMFRGVELYVILGQDLHDRPDLQPPLRPGDAVTVKDRPELTTCVDHQTILCTLTGGEATYSKSVSPFRSARGWNISALFFMPRTQAESGVFAKIRPNREESISYKG